MHEQLTVSGINQVPLLEQDPLEFVSLFRSIELTQQLPGTSLDPLAGEIGLGNVTLFLHVSSQ